MFHFNPLNRSEVERFETPFNKNLVEVCLDDLSVNPTGDPGWTPVHCVMPARYWEFAERIRNFTVYEDDVWIVTFPKAGTTWTQEMVWLIAHDLDYETATKVHLTERSVFLELNTFFTDLEVPDTISLIEQMPRPRHIKSHLPLALLPKQLWTVKPKIVYTARNPTDVTTSYMHHYRHLHGFQGSQQDFLDAILADRLNWCPQVKHATEFWRLAENRRDHVLFLHFEDMKRNMSEVLEKVGDFFGKSLSSEEVERLEKHLSFEVMKDNKFANNQNLVSYLNEAMGRKIPDFRFMRKGQIGSYKDELPEEYVNKLKLLVKNELKGTNFSYKE
ncbi:sulfotransferase 1A1 [Culex quinquefasciatus]|uniref:sulfotransferase 1A1 n=1 Tax=Culex quinquefasciatus TaxID=7176 RepID=UPI0018E2CBCA|nr:sulfotransferase 1A1 [Culex quinquefasciatus]